jgi:hypothetical protein
VSLKPVDEMKCPPVFIFSENPQKVAKEKLVDVEFDFL